MATTATVQAAINALSSTSTIGEATLLAYDTNTLTQNREIFVSSAIDLPDIALGKIAPGTVLFVDEYKVPVIATTSKWLGLDGRVLRSDVPPSNAQAWGSNTCGQLGNCKTLSSSSPVEVAGLISDWSQVDAGSFHSLGVRANGTAWAWGQNKYGELGDGTATPKSSPVQIAGGFTDWIYVSASIANFGFSHSLGLRSNGTAWAWGSNGSGQLGIGVTGYYSSPTLVVGGFTDWCQVSAGGDHSLGVRTNGTAWGWGADFGTLGSGGTGTTSSPVSVVGGFTDWCWVSASVRHSLGLRTNGTVWAWGQNGYGQLGDCTTVSKNSPVSVVGGFTDWSQISVGSYHSLGLRSNGTLWSWGQGGTGKLGDNTTTNKSSPVSVVGGFTDWCQISGGDNHSAGIRTNGTAWAWGCNATGQLGDGTTVSKSSPVQVCGGITNWCAVSAGCEHTLAIRVAP